jgi:hypothetical protein
VSETWIDAGPADKMLLEDVAPFEHDGKSYALYRTADDRFRRILLKKSLIDCRQSSVVIH